MGYVTAANGVIYLMTNESPDEGGQLDKVKRSQLLFKKTKPSKTKTINAILKLLTQKAEEIINKHENINIEGKKGKTILRLAKKQHGKKVHYYIGFNQNQSSSLHPIDSHRSCLKKITETDLEIIHGYLSVA